MAKKETKEPAISEGESVIKEFLEDQVIKFEMQKPLPPLEGDSKTCRFADFYLTEYKVYIEFFGRWNIEEGREEYQYKKEIYYKNNIPCIYVYPENLGALNYLFKRRLIKELRKHNLKKELFNFRYILWVDEFKYPLLIGGYFTYLLIQSLSSKPVDFTQSALLSLVVIFFWFNPLKEFIFILVEFLRK